MLRPLDAYREGYEKALQDNLAGHVAEAIFGMMKEDPGGHRAAGYRDGAAGKRFNPPAVEEPRSRKRLGSRLSALEKQWYWICDESDFLPQYVIDQYVAALRAQGSEAAIVVGLSDFTGSSCLRCGSPGQFKIRFLGRIRHPGHCAWAGYISTLRYAGYQVTQVFHTGVRAGGRMKDDADSKGDARGGWVYGIVGFLIMGVLRAAIAVVLVKIHAIVTLFHSDQTAAQRAIRTAVLAAVLIVIGWGIYAFRHGSTGPTAQLATAVQPSPTLQVTMPIGSFTASETVPKPSFNCAAARTSVELLICRDADLAAMDVQMVGAYREALNRLPEEQRVVFKREHLVWFKNYSRRCNASSDDTDRATCVANSLSVRTTELKAVP